MDSDYFIGKTLGKCTIESLIGFGGMAWVFLAKHRELGVKRAIKVLKPVSKDMDKEARKQFTERFIREARISASLEHKNIIKIHDVGAFEDTFYIEMEYLDGNSLKESIKSIKVSSRALPQEIQACMIYLVSEAFYYAHNCDLTYEDTPIKGIIHRDIKPENIFITKSGELRILDFGIAKMENVDLTTSTEARTITGTFAYMSPEQIDGEVLDKRSDIFSLGIVFYELLTSVHPFREKQTSKTVKNICSGTYQPPSENNAGLHNIFENIISGCLKIDLNERFQSVKEIQGLAFKYLSSKGIFNPEESFREFVQAGRIKTEKNVIVKPSFSFLKLAASLLVLSAVVFGSYFLFSLVRGIPGPKENLVKGPFKVVNDTTPEKPLATPLSQMFENKTDSIIPEKLPLATPEKHKKRPIKNSSRKKKTYTRSKTRSTHKNIPAPPPPAPKKSQELLIQNMIITHFKSGNMDDGMSLLVENPTIKNINKSIDYLPSNYKATFYFEGYRSYLKKDYKRATLYLDAVTKKPTMFKEHRMFFIKNSLKYRAKCYHIQYLSNKDISLKEKAIRAYEGFLKVSKNEYDNKTVNEILNSLKKKN